MAHPTRGAQGAEDTLNFRYNTRRPESIFVDMDNRLRSQVFKGNRVCRNCPSRTLQEVETRSIQIIREGENLSRKKTKVGSKTMENTSSILPNLDVEDTETRYVRIQTERSRSPVMGVILRGSDEAERQIKSEKSPVAFTKVDLERQERFIKLAKTLFTYFLPLEFS